MTSNTAGLRGLERQVLWAAQIRAAALPVIEDAAPAIFERQARAAHRQIPVEHLEAARQDGRAAVARLLVEYVTESRAEWWIDNRDHFTDARGIEQLMMYSVARRHAELLPTAHADLLRLVGPLAVNESRLLFAAKNGVSDLFGAPPLDEYDHLIRRQAPETAESLAGLFPDFPVIDGDRAWTADRRLGLAPDGDHLVVLIDGMGRPAAQGSLSISRAQFIARLIAGLPQAEATQLWDRYAAASREDDMARRRVAS
jgi:hypothetical protein